MNAYLCFGTYHFFQSINLKMHENKNDVCDIFVLNLFSGAKELSERLKKEQLFENVYFLDKDIIFNNKYIPNVGEQKNKLSQKLKSKIYNLMNHNILLSDRIYRNTPLYKKKYDKLFTFGNYLYLDRFCLYQTIKKGAKNYCVENGLGTRIRNTSKAGGVYEKRLKWGFGNYRNSISGTYMCSPKNTLFYNERNIINQQKPINLNQRQKEQIKRIYEYDEDNNFIETNDFIFIGSQFGDLSYVSEDYKYCGQKEEEFLQLTNSILKNEKLYVKHHPNKLGIKKERVNTNVPIEVLLSNTDVKNKVFIALYSTILYTPKLIFNQEPYIIFMYKAIGMNVKNIIKMPKKDFDDANKAILTDAYKQKDRVFIPETKEEFKNILYMLKQTTKF